MTSQEARTFERRSAGNIATIRASLGCSCKPYGDVFTYKRWKAQGYQVQKGEKSIRLVLVKDVAEKDKDGKKTDDTRRIVGTSSVFCRHQVIDV